MQRVPFNLNALAIPNLVLPWLALALWRLREEPTAPRTAMLLVAFVVAVLASLYAAVLAGIFCAVWGGWEFLRARAGRGRHLAWCALVALAGACVLLLVLQPYLATMEARSGAFPRGTRLQASLRSAGEAALWFVLIAGNYAQSVHLAVRSPLEVLVLLAAPVPAVLAWWRKMPLARELVVPAVLLWVGFATLAWGYPGPLDRLISATPLRSFR